MFIYFVIIAYTIEWESEKKCFLVTEKVSSGNFSLLWFYIVFMFQLPDENLVLILWKKNSWWKFRVWIFSSLSYDRVHAHTTSSLCLDRKNLRSLTWFAFSWIFTNVHEYRFLIMSLERRLISPKPHAKITNDPRILQVRALDDEECWLNISRTSSCRSNNWQTQFFIVFNIRVSHLCSCVLQLFQFLHGIRMRDSRTHIAKLYISVSKDLSNTKVCLSHEKRFTGGREWNDEWMRLMFVMCFPPLVFDYIWIVQLKVDCTKLLIESVELSSQYRELYTALTANQIIKFGNAFVNFSRPVRIFNHHSHTISSTSQMNHTLTMNKSGKTKTASITKTWQKLPPLTLDEELLGFRLTAGAAEEFDVVVVVVWGFSLIAATAGGVTDATTAAAWAGVVTWSAGSDSGTVWRVGRTMGLPEVADIAKFSVAVLN